MKSKAIPVLVVSLISMLLLMAFSVNVAAENGDPPELDNDKNIYFQYAPEGEVDGEVYNYNYSSDIYSNTDIVGDGDGWYGPEFHYDNQIHLTANVQSVTSDEHRNTINFYVVAQGAYEFNETATPGDVDPKDPEWLVDYAGTTHVPIEAEITDMEGGNQEYDIDDFDYDSNTVTGNNMSLQDDEANEEDRDLLMDVLAFQAVARAHAVLDVAPITGPSTVIGTLQAADKYLAPHFLDPNPHPEEEDQDWKPYEKLQKTWPLDYESYGYEEDPDNYRSYSAAAVFQLRVNHPLPDSLTLEFSARNILDIWIEGSLGGPFKDFTEGAEASVEIPIKNAEPQLDENEVEVTNEPVEVSESGDGYVLEPDIYISSSFLDNPAGCTDAEYDLHLYYSKDGADWNHHGTTEGRTIDVVSAWYTSMNIDGQASSDQIELKVTVTAHDEYGAWEEEVQGIYFDLDLPVLSISTDGSGTTDPSTGTHEYYPGETVQVSAYPSTDWEFSHWSGSIYSSDNPVYVEIDDDKYLTANFDYDPDDDYICPICGGIIGHCGCGGINSDSHEATLEGAEYGEYLEEGTISEELLEALAEEGIDDLDEDATLSETEEGWWIIGEGEKEYWIHETEDKLEIYAVEESEES